MNFDYIIIQAGGKGTRLEHLTTNKPKALVPVENLPMIFHLFRKFPEKKFIIIADYKKEVLREYLSCFAEVKYQVVEATGEKTCGGLKQALALLPENEPFMFIWSDLILSKNFNIPNNEHNYIGISETFICRWSYKDGNFEEVKSEEHGVAGLFVFKNKSYLKNVPESGEFVRWLKSSDINFKTLGLAGTKEFGLLSEYETLEKEKCRPFNKMTVDGDILIKEAIDEQGKKLALLEQKWYEYAIDKNIKNIPKIHSFDPIRMEKINGKNIYETHENKIEILRKLVDALKNLHSVKQVPTDTFSLKDAYYTKTMSRLHKIRDLVPFADKKTIKINGRECRNIYYYKRDLERRLDALKCDKFTFIHGDCTFSNLMLRNDNEPILIDPRGYFGFTKLYGDPNYDWAKLYYSIVGNYDRFNLKDFRLSIGENAVDLKIESNCWEDMEQDFFALSGTDPQTIKLLHAIIWLSLTTYAWQDYDSICGAFYNGLYYLEEVL
jgi:GTP:adenosylcobinamide-phosphate guanylyltransferase/thiamine kinase-like enzyme